MWLTKERATPGNVFGSMDKFNGLGIFFDTYKNNRPGTVFPYVMAMNGDGQTPYDKDNDGKANEVAGCSVRPQELLRVAVPVLITSTGPRNPQRRHPHQSPHNLLRRPIPKTRTPIQDRRRMDRMLRHPQLQGSSGRIPRFQRRNGRTLR